MEIVFWVEKRTGVFRFILPTSYKLGISVHHINSPLSLSLSLSLSSKLIGILVSMAFCCASSSSSKPQNGFKNIQNTEKITYLIDDTCMQKAQGSSIAQDQAVNYFPTEDYNFLPEYHSSTVKF